MSLTATPYVISALQHSAQLFRQTLQDLIGGTGVVGFGDLEVAPHVAANLSVNVEPGNVFIPGTQGSTAGQRSNAGSQHGTYASIPLAFTSQGVYAAVAPSVTNVALTEANAANPRIDLICAVVQDAQYSGSFNQVLVVAVTGTPAGSPVAPTPPENSVVLAQVAVAAKATKIEAAQITNERPVAGPTSGRMSWGSIAFGGGILASSGDFTVAKTGSGEYEIKWNTEKSSASYAVVCGQEQVQAFTQASTITKKVVHIKCLNNAGAATNENFYFIAVSA